ncbi:lathosterol oxidase-like [Daphnia pulex]|uniref:lathosterol oxidase-like n=1 Tax=Daphnia pulex TaxID=6669 RepID=UPI001EDF4EC1|nr:lathosterol oxidase-like [Daphnia pulex]
MAIQNRMAVDPMAVTWSERYNKTFEKVWAKLPNFIGSFIATAAVFILGSSIHGDWLLILVHFIKYLRHGQEDNNSTMSSSDEQEDSSIYGDFSLKDYKLQDLSLYIIPATIVSYVTYFGVGGFLHWYYYVRQRDRPEEWKCQPTKWLSPKLERHEILLGSLSLLFGSILSGIMSCYIMNGGDTYIYYNYADYGYLWAVLQWPAIFIWQDYLTYWGHRAFHMPFLYKHFHKLHHTYKQPTAFSVTAIHPAEFLFFQCILISPMFLVPTHWITITILLFYTYYHGIIDHSGINFKAYWWQPWQPHCIFHDNHHQYFHVNFGFNIEYWDKLHGTYRKKDRVYREEFFYGQGKSLDEVTEGELAQDLAERESENPLAYDNNQYAYELKRSDVKKRTKKSQK